VTPKLIQKVAKTSCNLSLNVKMEDIRASTSPSEFVKTHNVSGGPSPEQVKKMLKTRKQWIVQSKSRLADEKSTLNKAENMLKSVIKSYLTSDNSKDAKLKSENG
jgi:hypothetical protein